MQDRGALTPNKGLSLTLSPLYITKNPLFYYNHQEILAFLLLFAMHDEPLMPNTHPP